MVTLLLLVIAAAHAFAPWEVSSETLPCGMRVATNPDARLPLVAVHLRIGVGAASDPPGRPGRAHLAEHLAFPDGDAVTTHDAMDFSWVADPGGVSKILDEIRLRLLVAAPPPSARAVATQAAVATWEAAGRVSGDLRARMRALALYPPGHPYHAPAAGTAEGLALWGADASGVAAFLDAAFRPAHAILALSGDLDAAQLDGPLARLRELPASNAGSSAQAALPSPRSGQTTEIIGASTADLVAVWPTVPAGDPDEAALDLVAALLARDPALRGGATFTLNRALAGELIVSLPRARLSSALRALDRALNRLRHHPPDGARLALAAAPWERWAADAGEGLEARAALLADCLSRAGLADCRAWEVTRHRAVHADQISAALDRYLTPSRRLLLSLVPAGQEDRALPPHPR